MFLVDTNVISEMRKGRAANAGVRAFFQDAKTSELYVSEQIAAVALIHVLTIVTRKVQHLQSSGEALLNPFR